jgi:hypothetical protein
MRLFIETKKGLLQEKQIKTKEKMASKKADFSAFIARKKSQ